MNMKKRLGVVALTTVLVVGAGIGGVALIAAGMPERQPEYAVTPIAADKLSPGMSTVAEFYAPDGKTAGSVRVTLVETPYEDDPDAFGAELEFIDFSSEHEQLVVGGSLEPRGNSQCFAISETRELSSTGERPHEFVRAGAGMFNPSNFDVENDIGKLVAAVEPHGLYEIVLHDSSGCQLILASAALNW